MKEILREETCVDELAVGSPDLWRRVIIAGNFINITDVLSSVQEEDGCGFEPWAEDDTAVLDVGRSVEVDPLEHGVGQDLEPRWREVGRVSEPECDRCC